MKVVVQRCTSAKCLINKQVYSEINHGLVLFVGFGSEDKNVDLDYMVKKIINMRIFESDDGKMNLSVVDVKGSILSVSQFTLYANTKKGNRPSFVDALNPEDAKKLYEKFNMKLSEYVNTKTGIFAEDMKIDLINDGPVTILMEDVK